MQLSPHFSLEEFTYSPTAVRLGIDNQPDAQHLAALRNLAAKMEDVRAALGGLPIHVDSAYRCPELNAAVGGVPDSAHMQGHACDFVCPGYGTPFEIANRLAQMLARTGIKFDQLIHERGVWVHIAFQDTVYGQRNELLTLQADGSYTEGIHLV